jgi:hypothetical protein
MIFSGVISYELKEIEEEIESTLEGLLLLVD